MCAAPINPAEIKTMTTSTTMLMSNTINVKWKRRKPGHLANQDTRMSPNYRRYVSGSSKIQTMSFDSSSINYSDGNTHRLLKLLFFNLECAGQVRIYYPVGVSHTHLNCHVIL